MKMRNKVFYSAKTQYENLGDGVIGCKLLEKMRNIGDLFVDNRMSPVWFDKVLGLNFQESIRDLNIGFKRTLIVQAIKSWFGPNNVYLVLKPGHIFGGGSFIREFSYTSFLFLLFVLRVRVVRYGCSIGPFDRVATFFEPIKSLFYWDYTAREQLSLDYATDLGVKKVRYSPDMAFALNYVHGSEFKKYKYALSFRTGTITENENAYTQKLENHLLGSKLLSEYSNKLLFVSQVRRDDEYLLELQKKFILESDNLFFEGSFESQEKIFNIYQDVDYVISNRLHVLLFAASQGAIPIPIVELKYHTKIVGIFTGVGLGDLIFDIDGKGTLDKKIYDVLSNKEFIRRRIIEVFNLKNKLLENIVKI